MRAAGDCCRTPRPRPCGIFSLKSDRNAVALRGGEFELTTALRAGLDTFDELFEDSDIECAGGGGFWMELAADDEPIVIFVFDSFDDTILAASGHAEGVSESVDRHVVSTGDADFTFAVDTSEDGV